MTLDEAIQHCKEVAIEYEAKGECYECGKEHRQLAEWLEDYKELKEHFQSLPDWLPVWVSCEEAMPEEHDDVLVAMKSGKYKSIHIGYAYNSGDWMIDGEFWYEEGDPSITHWMPLPEMPKGDAE